jgi:uncharacterized membrane protein
MEHDPIVYLVPVFLIVLVLCLRKAHQMKKKLDEARIEQKDGTLRPLTQQERMSLGTAMAHDKGKYFWYLIISGIIIIALVIIVMKFIIVPRFL